MLLHSVFQRGVSTGVVGALLVLFGSSPASAQQTGVVEGRITSPDGMAVSRATVVVDGTGLQVQAGDPGTFRIAGIPTGNHTLRVTRLGYAARTVEVVVRAGQVTHLAVEMEPVVIELRGLSVIGSDEELAEVRTILRDVPGGVALIEPAEIQRTRQSNFKDVLRFTPGVLAQPRFGAADESQLSIRGSGLRNNFHLRGVNLLVNGMPYRNADGFTDFESLDLLTTDNIQIYKGANALRYSGATMGGAINLSTKTGYTASPLNFFVQGGLYDSFTDDLPFFKGQVSSGQVFDRFNYYVSYARTQVGSYREYADQRRDRVNVQLGYRLSPDVDARAFYFFAYVEEDLPGSLTAEEFRANPRQAAATNVENQWGRDYSLHHVGVQLRAQLTPTQRLEVSPYGQFRDIIHPIFRVLDQVSGDGGAEIRYENTADIGGHRNRLTLGFQPAFGRTDNRHFDNVGGLSGELRKDQQEEAALLTWYAEDVFAVTEGVSVVAGLRYDRTLRRVNDSCLDDGDQSDERWMDALQPRLGLIFELPDVPGQVYTNASRAFEPPLLLELNSLTVPGFIDLDPQTAWQFEIGTRGRAGGFGWDVAFYDIEFENEIININVQPFPDAPFTVPTYRNVDRTRHYGVEAGIDYRFPLALFTESRGGDELGFRVAYTWNRFTYVDDLEFGDNDLPGAPEHVLNAELAYRHPVGLSLRPNVEWVPGSYFANSENTLSNDGWTLLGVRAEWLVPRARATFFVEGRNLTDEVYSPAVNVDDASGRYLQPGDGRSLYSGVRWQF